MEENISQKEKEKAEEEMIEQAFQELLNDYLATKHRKRVENNNQSIQLCQPGA